MRRLALVAGVLMAVSCSGSEVVAPAGPGAEPGSAVPTTPHESRSASSPPVPSDPSDTSPASSAVPGTTALGPPPFADSGLVVDAPARVVTAFNFADPDIVNDDGTYFAFATEGNGKNVQRLRSTDLIVWEPDGDALPLTGCGASPNGCMGDWAITRNGFSPTWAPAVHELDGTWVLYYSALVKGSDHCIGRAVSETGPGGTFHDDSPVPFLCPEDRRGGIVPVIDPSVFEDRDGSAYLLWKEDGPFPNTTTPLMSQRLDATGSRLLGRPAKLLERDQAWEARDRSGLPDQIEQPEMIERNGRYLLFYSGSNWDTPKYAIGYASCESPLPAHPCQKQTVDDRPWLAGMGPDGVTSSHPAATFRMTTAAGPGAASFVADQTGTTWMAFHAWIPVGKIRQPGGVRSMHVQKVVPASR